jgi:hypothetical protein
VTDHLPNTGPGALPTINAEAIRPVLELASRLHDGDTLGAARCARLAIRAAGSPAQALIAAAALIDIDRPMVRWWEPLARRRCRWCSRPLPADYRRWYCGPDCHADARRAYWRQRARIKRARVAVDCGGQQRMPSGAA